jgi:NitT/TauT family transport system ATP-binding protein
VLALVSVVSSSSGINVAGVDHSYHNRSGSLDALRGLDLSVPRGEFASLLGPSGCGKTTTLMLLAGLRKATAGSVSVFGAPVERPRTDIGIVFQSPLLLEWRTALGNVCLQLEVRGTLSASTRAYAEKLLQSVGLDGFEHKYPRELSRGMQHRVSLCRALVHQPSLLLMDEPFAALDMFTREELLGDLQALWMEHAFTAFLVTHSIREALFLSDRVFFMTARPGRVCGEIRVELERPRPLAVQTTPLFNSLVDQAIRILRGHSDHSQRDEDP